MKYMKKKKNLTNPAIISAGTALYKYVKVPDRTVYFRHLPTKTEPKGKVANSSNRTESVWRWPDLAFLSLLSNSITIISSQSQKTREEETTPDLFGN